MRNNKAKAARLIGGAGGGNVAVGTDGGKPLYSPSDVYYNHVEQIVNPFSGPIPTASGGPVHWSICDSLATFRLELEKAGIVKADDPRVWAAQVRAWQQMAQASYLQPEDLAVWPEVGEVTQ